LVESAQIRWALEIIRRERLFRWVLEIIRRGRLVL
jgi:hypothetical protein